MAQVFKTRWYGGPRPNSKASIPVAHSRGFSLELKPPVGFYDMLGTSLDNLIHVHRVPDFLCHPVQSQSTSSLSRTQDPNAQNSKKKKERKEEEGGAVL